MADFRVGQFVAHAPAIRNGNNETASAKASQVVRHVLPCRFEKVGQVSRVTGCFAQGEKDASPSRIRKGMAKAGKHLAMSENLHSAMVQRLLYQRSSASAQYQPGEGLDAS